MMCYSETQRGFPVQPPYFQEELDTRNESDLPFPGVANWQGPIVLGARVTDPVTVSSTSAMSRGYV